MIKYLLLALIVLTNQAVLAQDIYQTYLTKVFGDYKSLTKTFATESLDTDKEAWLEDLDKRLNIVSYDADIKFTLDREGHIEDLKLVDLRQKDFEAFKDFISELVAFEFVVGGKLDLSAYEFELEASTLYLARTEEYDILSPKPKAKDLADKLANKDSNYILVSPKNLGYTSLGQKVIFKNQDDLYLEAFVTDIGKKAINLKAYKAYDEDEVSHVDFSFDLKRPKDENYLSNLFNTSIGTAISTGFMTAYSSYGVVPGLAALGSLTGKALISNETDKSFSLNRGEELKLEEK